MNRAAINCLAATRLLSDEHERVLTPGETAALETHLETCPACVECGLQFRALGEVARAWRELA